MIYSGTIESKTGALIPLFTDGKPMHSKYNPLAEASSFEAALPQDSKGQKASCIVACGIGAGFHLASLVKAGRLVFAVEADEESLSFCLQLDSVKELLQYPNFIVCTEENLCSQIVNNYLPQVHGGIVLAPHRAWEDRAIVCCSNIRSLLALALKQVAADYSVQAHFGKLWQRNIFLNLKDFKNENSELFFDTKKIAAVIAAGPSLDQSLQEIQLHPDKYCVFATDTALSVLQDKGIQCDAVVSIDAQHVSLTHFENLNEKSTKPRLCFFDLASCHECIQAAREAGIPTLFVHTGHPLAQLAAEEAYIPRIQAGSGTVTIASCDIARKLGFEKIQLFGADFAYGGGKPYAKGTYLDRLYNKASNKTLPSEQIFSSLMYRTQLIDKDEKTKTTEVLEGYRKTLAEWMSMHSFSQKDKVWICSSKQETFSFEKSAKDFDFTSFVKKWCFQLEKQFNEKDKKITPYLTSLLPLVAYFQAKENQKIGFFELSKLAYSYSLRYTK